MKVQVSLSATWPSFLEDIFGKPKASNRNMAVWPAPSDKAESDLVAGLIDNKYKQISAPDDGVMVFRRGDATIIIDQKTVRAIY